MLLGTVQNIVKSIQNFQNENHYKQVAFFAWSAFFPSAFDKFQHVQHEPIWKEESVYQGSYQPA